MNIIIDKTLNRIKTFKDLNPGDVFTTPLNEHAAINESKPGYIYIKIFGCDDNVTTAINLKGNRVGFVDSDLVIPIEATLHIHTHAAPTFYKPV